MDVFSSNSDQDQFFFKHKYINKNLLILVNLAVVATWTGSTFRFNLQLARNGIAAVIRTLGRSTVTVFAVINDAITAFEVIL